MQIKIIAGQPYIALQMRAFLSKTAHARKFTALISLFFLCASVLTTAHIHVDDEPHHGHDKHFALHLEHKHEHKTALLDSDLVDSCSVYHVVDAQQVAANEALSIGEIIDLCYFAFSEQEAETQPSYLPPARASPVSS